MYMVSNPRRPYNTVMKFVKYVTKHRAYMLVILIHQYSALRPVLAGTRTQSGYRYGSGTLQPGQILRGRLPLLCSAFRHSHLLRQVPSRPTTRETPSSGRWNSSWARNVPTDFVQNSTSTYFQRSFTCRKSATWDIRLYFPSEGRRAEDFSPLKIRRLRPSLNPRTWVPKASTLTPRPPKHICTNKYCKFILNYSNMFRC